MLTTISAADLLSRTDAAPVITSFRDAHLGGKLMSMGILPGSRIQVIRKAPLGGGWYVRVDRQVVALRREELACIITSA